MATLTEGEEDDTGLDRSCIGLPQGREAHQLLCINVPPVLVRELIDTFFSTRSDAPNRFEALTSLRNSDRTAVTWAKAKGCYLAPENVFVNSGRTLPLRVEGLNFDIYFHKDDECPARKDDWARMTL